MKQINCSECPRRIGCVVDGEFVSCESCKKICIFSIIKTPEQIREISCDFCKGFKK